MSLEQPKVRVAETRVLVASADGREAVVALVSSTFIPEGLAILDGADSRARRLK